MTLDQLRALQAVVEHETFEAAAYELGVSASAISQRIKSLERSVGQVIVQRTIPVTPTDAGASLLQLARQVTYLHDQTYADLGVEPHQSRDLPHHTLVDEPADQSIPGAQPDLTHPPRPVNIPIAVNADSLASWFTDVFALAARWGQITLDLRVEDQEYSADLLRRGEVMAAVTSQYPPVAGCVSHRLGTMRYLAVATPALAHSHGMYQGNRGHQARTGQELIEAWGRLPMMVFNRKDTLQHDVLAAAIASAQPPSEATPQQFTVPPIHYVPSSREFTDAVYAGLGWGVIPEAQARDRLAAGLLIELPGTNPTDIQLYWQYWNIESRRLEHLHQLVEQAAAAHLH